MSTAVVFSSFIASKSKLSITTFFVTVLVSGKSLAGKNVLNRKKEAVASTRAKND